MITKNNLPIIIKKLTNRLNHAYPTARLYLVGGAVRDLLLGRVTKDYDLVISGLTKVKLEKFLKGQGKVALVGKTFGVYKFTPRGWPNEAIDVALPRTDHAWGTGRYRDFTVKTASNLSINEDLERRDFTINAIALDLTSYQIIDPTKGQKDLKNKIIRTVGAPRLRFQEDYSRLLRALRFACQLNFKIESRTLMAIKKMASKSVVAKTKDSWVIPREIVAREWLKSLQNNPSQALKLWDQINIIKVLLPEVYAMHGVPQYKEFHSEGDVFEHTLLALKIFSSREWRQFFPKQKPSLSVLLAILLHDIGKPLTVQTPEIHGVKWIRTPEHDIKGAALVSDIISRLKLTSFLDSAGDKIEPELVEWLVAKHMLLVHGKVAEFKPSTLYRYFYQKALWGISLQQVILADSWATNPADGRKLFDRLRALRKRLKQLKPLLSKKGELKLLVDGNQIMKLFKLKSGPIIGKLLKSLTEAQLAKKVKTKIEAISFLKKQL
ncbi:MAG: CCA tRNA nucleotidyltransferase [Patescibacteria group bacterium]